MQDISNLAQTKFIIKPESNKSFLLDLKKITQAGIKQIDLALIVNQAAQLNLEIIGYGELLVDLNLKIELMGIDAQVRVSGALFMTKKSDVKFSVWQNHSAPSAQSDVQVKTILLDRAQFVYEGTILIAEHAIETIAHQENKNIVLSKEVSVKSTPNIEVLNSNVQCSHGSAVGGLDHEQLVYLMSRGLDKTLATKILLQSFLGSDLDFDFE